MKIGFLNDKDTIMRAKILIFSMLIMIVNFTFCKSSDKNRLIPVEFGGKWGYIDQNGKWAINPQFYSANRFGSNGLALVRSGFDDYKYGFIDQTGKWIINPQFDSAIDFDDDELTGAAIDEQWGLIYKTGQWIVNPQFSYCPQHSQGLYIVENEDEKYGVIDKCGKIIAPITFDKILFNDNGLISVMSDGKWGLMDNKEIW